MPKQHVPLRILLSEKYGYEPEIAQQAEEVLLPMLAYEPKLRISAKECLLNKWLWE